MKGMSDSKSVSSELAEPYLNYSRLQGDVEIVAFFYEVLMYLEC